MYVEQQLLPGHAMLGGFDKAMLGGGVDVRTDWTKSSGRKKRWGCAVRKDCEEGDYVC